MHMCTAWISEVGLEHYLVDMRNFDIQLTEKIILL